MRVLLLFLALTVATQAQSFENIYTGYVTDGDTVLSTNTLEPTLTSNRGVLLFDTLNVIVQAGDGTGAAAGIVYVQTQALGRWSQGVPIETLTVAAGNTGISYPLDMNALVNYRTDTLRNKWFLSTGAGTVAKTRILAIPGWKYRVFVVGTTGNPSTGGYFKVDRFYF